MSHGIHAHIIPNNQILIHYHNTHKSKDKHHCNDCNPKSAATYSTLLTFIRSNFFFAFKNILHPLINIWNIEIQDVFHPHRVNTHLLRAPPFLIFNILSTQPN